MFDPSRHVSRSEAPWRPYFVASFNRRSAVSGRSAEVSNLSILIPAEQYVKSDWFAQRFRITDPTADLFDKVRVMHCLILA